MERGSERFEYLFGNLPAFLLFLFIFLTFGVIAINGNYLSMYFGQFPDTGVFDLVPRVEVAPLKGIELLLVPLTAFVVARWPVGADRFPAMRTGKLGELRPFLFFVSLLAVFGYFVVSVQEPLVSDWPQQFSAPRWFGALLLVLFTWYWQPLYPRLTANLAAMVVGPAVIAVIGYAFYDSYSTYQYSPDSYRESGPMEVLFLVPLMIAEAPLLRISSARTHAIWTGTVMTGAALIGLAILAD